MQRHRLPIFAFVLAAAVFGAPAAAGAEVRPIAFPVGGTHSFRNDFAEPRDGGARSHIGIDILADKMTPLLATVDGTVAFIAIPEPSWGYSITIRDAEGYSYRYLHINNDTPGTDDGNGGEANAYAAGLTRGSSVTKGQVIGWVGDSGNAEGTVPHLHFEMYAPDRTVINPYETLVAAAGSQSSILSGTSPTVEHAVEISVDDEERFIATRLLREGMTDPSIVQLREELLSLGYDSGTITEAFDAATREAVRRFQRDNAISPNGIADALTRKTIALQAKRLRLAPVATAPVSSASLSVGSRGDAVLAVQTTLKSLGFLEAEPTGYFGELTKAAVLAFQRAKGIEAIGIVGPKTLAALASAGSPVAGPPFTFTALLEEGMRGDAVRELQLRLAKGGYFKAEATGFFGALTRAAVILFQEANGIDPLGIVGPKTREALNAVN